MNARHLRGITGGIKMDLKVKVEVQEEATIFKLKGILDISTNKVIESYLNKISNTKELILDFSELEFIDSTGIGSIINAIYMSQEDHFALKLTGVDETIHEVFETVGLYQILETIQEVGI